MKELIEGWWGNENKGREWVERRLMGNCAKRLDDQLIHMYMHVHVRIEGLHSNKYYCDTCKFKYIVLA